MRYFTFLIALLLVSCTSTKSTIKNIDNTAVRPPIKDGAYALTEYANDSKYGYDADYPINIGLILDRQEETYLGYFFKALEGKNGEKIASFERIDTCCPYPTKNNLMGAGTLVLYKIKFEGSENSKLLYFNIYEKGKLMCPNGFKIKSNTN